MWFYFLVMYKLLVMLLKLDLTVLAKEKKRNAKGIRYCIFLGRIDTLLACFVVIVATCLSFSLVTSEYDPGS